MRDVRMLNFCSTLVALTTMGNNLPSGEDLAMAVNSKFATIHDCAVSLSAYLDDGQTLSQLADNAEIFHAEFRLITRSEFAEQYPAHFEAYLRTVRDDAEVS